MSQSVSSQDPRVRLELLERSLIFLISRFTTDPCGWVAQAIAHQIEMLMEVTSTETHRSRSLQTQVSRTYWQGAAAFFSAAQAPPTDPVFLLPIPRPQRH